MPSAPVPLIGRRMLRQTVDRSWRGLWPRECEAAVRVWRRPEKHHRYCRVLEDRSRRAGSTRSGMTIPAKHDEVGANCVTDVDRVTSARPVRTYEMRLRQELLAVGPLSQ